MELEKYNNIETTDIETWKVAIKDKYLISDMGRIKNIKSGKITLGRNKPNTRLIFSFCFNGKVIQYDIARLVAEKFIPNTKGYKYVGFKNGILCDPDVSNLEWISEEEYSKRKKTNNKRVVKYKNDRQVKIYKSIKEAAEDNGMTKYVLRTHLTKKLKGINIRKTHYNGFRFEYYKEHGLVGNKNAG